jgi:hypothetical protein
MSQVGVLKKSPGTPLFLLLLFLLLFLLFRRWLFLLLITHFIQTLFGLISLIYAVVFLLHFLNQMTSLLGLLEGGGAFFHRLVFAHLV